MVPDTVANQFDLWKRDAFSSSSSSSSSSVTAKIQGIFCGSSIKGSVLSYRLVSPDVDVDPMFERATLRDGTIFVSVPRQEHANARVEPMDEILLEGCTESAPSTKDGRVFLNAKTVRRVKPWSLVVADKELAASVRHHILLPTIDGERFGPVFLMYSGTETEPVSFATSPGFHRAVRWDTAEQTWTKYDTQQQQRRLTVHFEQRQWDSLEDMAESVPRKLDMTIWDEHCQHLPGNGLTQNLDLWSALMQIHHIPFYALARVDSNFCKDNNTRLAVSVLALQWDVAAYLKSSSLPVSLTLETVKQILGLEEEEEGGVAKKGEVINVSATMRIPTGAGWTYFALTTDSDDVTAINSVILALGSVLPKPTGGTKAATTATRMKKRVKKENSSN